MVSLNPEAAPAVSHTVTATAIIIALILGIPILGCSLFALSRLYRDRGQNIKTPRMNEASRASQIGLPVRNSGLRRPEDAHVRRDERFDRGPEMEAPPPYSHEESPTYLDVTETERLLS